MDDRCVKNACNNIDERITEVIELVNCRVDELVNEWMDNHPKKRQHSFACSTGNLQ